MQSFVCYVIVSSVSGIMYGKLLIPLSTSTPTAPTDVRGHGDALWKFEENGRKPFPKIGRSS